MLIAKRNQKQHSTKIPTTIDSCCTLSLAPHNWQHFIYMPTLQIRIFFAIFSGGNICPAELSNSNRIRIFEPITTISMTFRMRQCIVCSTAILYIVCSRAISNSHIHLVFYSDFKDFRAIKCQVFREKCLRYSK